MQKQKILLKENINLLSWDFNSNHLNNARSTNHFYLMTISVSLKFVANEHVYIICWFVVQFYHKGKCLYFVIK